MVSLLGSMDMPFLINHISENVAEKLGGADLEDEAGGSLNDYINGFGNCIPPLKLQSYMLKFSGNYGAIEIALIDVLVRLISARQAHRPRQVVCCCSWCVQVCSRMTELGRQCTAHERRCSGPTIMSTT